MSPKVYPKASWFSLNKSKTYFSWSRVKSLASITGKVSSGPKNAYFKVLGRGFNSRKEDDGALGRWSLDGAGREVRDGRRDACKESSHYSSNANVSNSGS